MKILRSHNIQGTLKKLHRLCQAVTYNSVFLCDYENTLFLLTPFLPVCLTLNTWNLCLQRKWQKNLFESCIQIRNFLHNILKVEETEWLPWLKPGTIRMPHSCAEVKMIWIEHKSAIKNLKISNAHKLNSHYLFPRITNILSLLQGTCKS